MIERTVRHATVVMERHLASPPHRVFAAWSDPDERRIWDLPENGWVVAEHEHDFRVGGMERTRFGPPGNPRYMSFGHFLDIEPDARIISAGTMHDNDVRMTSTLATVELYADGEGTRLFLTDQSAFYGDEAPEGRSGGWGTIISRLEKYLAGKGQQAPQNK